MKIIEDIEKKFLCTIPVTSEQTITVFLVDGSFVRDIYDTSFVGGSNWMADIYVPENEIWLETQDNILHELIEPIIMSIYKKYNLLDNDHEKIYLEAHDLTTIIEGFIRQNIKYLI